MTDVLISYARRDRGVAARLAACLAERGMKAVWDVSELPEGELLKSAKSRAARAPAVVALWSEASARSLWVREEAANALERGALVSAPIDGTICPVEALRSVDLSAWTMDGAQSGLDALISAIADAASQSRIDAVEPEPQKPETNAPAAAAGVHDEQTRGAPPSPPGESAAAGAFIIIAFVWLLGVAVARQEARRPAPLPPISMDATEPLEAPVIIPSPEEENAPSGLRPVPDAAGPRSEQPQDSTGSVRK